MFLKSIKVKNFRNYSETSINLDNTINVFLGENAQGKTNLLESIYVLAMANSHRTPHDKELIQWGEEYAKIEGRVERQNGDVPLELVISKKGKKAKRHQIEQRKLSEYIGLCNVVMFAPEDLNLVKGNPNIRRRFINMELGQIHPVYMHQLTHYQKILQQRNALLKELSRKHKNGDPMLDILTEQLNDLGADIVYRRYRFIELLRDWAGPIHHSISRGLEELSLTYNSSVADVSEDMELSKIRREYEKAFERMQEKEIQRGTTLIEIGRAHV